LGTDLPRRIFGAKRGIRGEWRKLDNEDLHNLYSSPNTIRLINFCSVFHDVINSGYRPIASRGDQIKANMGTVRNMHGGMTNVYRFFVENHEGTISLGRPRRIRENNVKINLQEIGCEDMEWIHLVKDSYIVGEHETGISGFARRTLFSPVERLDAARSSLLVFRD
jgi:hypothetical protein